MQNHKIIFGTIFGSYFGILIGIENKFHGGKM